MIIYDKLIESFLVTIGFLMIVGVAPIIAWFISGKANMLYFARLLVQQTQQTVFLLFGLLSIMLFGRAALHTTANGNLIDACAWSFLVIVSLLFIYLATTQRNDSQATPANGLQQQESKKEMR